MSATGSFILELFQLVACAFLILLAIAGIATLATLALLAVVAHYKGQDPEE